MSGLCLAGAGVIGALVGVCGVTDRYLAWAIALAAGGLWPVLSTHRWSGGLAAVALAGGLAGLGASAREHALGPPLAWWYRHAGSPAGPVGLAGTIVEDAVALPRGGAALTVDVEALEDAKGWHSTSGRVRLHVSGTLVRDELTSWSRGREIRAPVSLRWPPLVRNPGSASVEWQALSRGFVLAGSVKSSVLVHVRPGRVFDEWAASVRRGVRRASTAVFGADVTASAITTAILIGDRAGLDAEIEDRLLDAGTYHVLAISGGNIAVLTAMVFFASRLLVRSAWLAPMLSLIVVGIYGAVVIGEASVTRAVTAALVWLAARVGGLDARPIPILGVAAIAVLILDPLAVIAPGAWLSFGATLGILTLAEPCARLLQAAWRGRFPHVIVGTLAASIAVEIALIPVSARVFSQVALAAPVFNLIAVPAMGLIQLAGAAAVGAWQAAPSLAACAATLASWGTAVIVESPRSLSAVPWLTWRVPPPAWWIGLFYASAIFAVTARVVPRAKAAAGAVCVALVLLLPVAGRGTRGTGWLRVTFLDVGQGDATVVEFPGGRSLLIDAGNRTDGFDVGERVVAPALWALGIRRLDWAVMSHADRDHSGGLPGVLSIFEPREVWEGVPVPGDAARHDVRHAASAAGATWREVRRGDRLTVDDVELAVLHPPIPEWERRRVRNDDSVVLRMSWGALDLLMLGDAGAAVEQEAAAILDGAAPRPIRILKVGHHGSATSTSADLLRAFRPAAAVISAGRNNPFGHPAAAVLSRLSGAGVRVFRTDSDGAVMMETDGRRVVLSTWNRPGTMSVSASGAPPP